MPVLVLPEVNADVPSEPSSVIAIAGNRKATVKWSPPSNTGGLPLKGYVVTSSTGRSCTAPKNANKCIVTGLPNLTAITFTVAAKNAEGVGSLSAESRPVVPFSKNAAATCGTADGIYSAASPNPNDLCLLGVPTAVQQGATRLYQWSCLGLGTGATASCSSAPWTPPKYKVGDKGPAGGTVFFVSSDQYHGLELAPALTIGETGEWGCIGQFLGATGTTIGSGASNTSTIASKCTQANTPAQLIKAFSLNGYSDWYMPSKDEMQHIIGNVSDKNALYWTSTEEGPYSITAWEWDWILTGPGQVQYTRYFSSSSSKWIWASSYRNIKFYPVRSF